jgi:DNA-binding HxlR family transcriptional regulator
MAQQDRARQDTAQHDPALQDTADQARTGGTPSPLAEALAEALARVGDRWTLLVVEALLDGARRFNELLDQLPGIAASILSERLKRLERDGLLLARLYSNRPPRAAYQLTADGRELAGALRLLAAWGAGHAEEAQALVHPACGTPVEARWYCPTCDHLVDGEPDDAELRYV